MLVIVKKDYDDLSKEAAKIVADRLQKKPNLVLGLATGSTPLGLYKELIRMHKYEGLDFSKVTTFNLDEYVGLPPSHDQSYHYFMQKNFFDNINIDPRFIHVPHGMAKDVSLFCEWYEGRIESLGGIDVQVLGIGANGHIAFNEPGSSLGSRTRIKTLTSTTREANKRFFDKDEQVPKYAITIDRKVLSMIDYLVVNELEAGFLTGMEVNSEKKIKEAASKLEGTYVDTWESIVFD